MSPPENTLSPSSTSLSLLERAKAKDEFAWRRLLRLYGPLVYHECRAMGVSAQDSPDVMQNVFRKLATGLPRFHHSRPGDSFRAWLATIARNCIRDYFKRQASQPAAVGGSEMHRALEEFPDLDLSDSSISGAPTAKALIVRRAIPEIQCEFEPSTWMAFWKTTVEGAFAADAAEQLGMSKAAVYQARSRVLRRLRQELEGLLD